MDVACNVVDIGTVKAKIYDGIICTFSNMRQGNPYLTLNLHGKMGP